MRRILLACSLLASTAAMADLQMSTSTSAAINPALQQNVLSSQADSAKFSANFVSSADELAWLQVHPLSSGRVSSNFGTRVMGGKREGHSGLDIAAPTGTPIVATGPGQVTKAGWGTGYGQYVEIQHNNGYVTRYAHASRIHVNVGDWVSAGQHIANVGCTGRCTGPHLHYEVVKNGKRQNPSTYLAMLP
ncbi:MAG: M23 family metallopeptidase [Acinetobacter sp.]|nr:M23 family metallopeptidase [Acinetobacter sp.]